ncbi:substrate-binding domain-containing protein [Maridesulfovibrio salexigens]|uniref:Ribose operon repressor n=1 Tax=Maridesulfovibrio salexigens (strain ATCC 14822 / DSM 2638 / NCIMB 8403 / VKM B-1763) TaxID=526222 RepID=C6BY74_MARSD|nr:substrate-binding domain-containing protein [Maridesulfovibrio salexigens]ACS80604.1 transcriptional regulator, LacI family [Maridesulfovibrio salexigens DSM 2638]
MATIKDVAKLAGVSTSTVSHVLNRTRFVSDEKRELVERAVEELNYRPSSIARSLKVQQTRTLGMLVTASRNPFFAEVVHGVERRCYERGYTLFLCNTEGDINRMEANLDALEEKRVDGLLLLCSEVNDEIINLIEAERSVPIVVFDWGPESDNVDRIYDNSLSGARLATKYLIAKGHTDIGCIAGPQDRRSAKERLEGYRQAMVETGLPVRDEWIVEGDYGCEGGVEAMHYLFGLDKLPSAVFVCNDMMAIGMLSEAVRLGVRVPQDLSVIGYDNVYISRFTAPALTTIHQPKKEIAARAVDTLIDRLSSKRIEGLQIKVEPSLVERESVSNLKK